MHFRKSKWRAHIGNKLESGYGSDPAGFLTVFRVDNWLHPLHMGEAFVFGSIIILLPRNLKFVVRT